MGHRPFDKPLALVLPFGDVYVADSVWELEQYLDLFWPDDDESLDRLKRLCADGLDGWISADMIRQEALRAAQRQNLLRNEGYSSLRFRAVNQTMTSQRQSA